MKFALAAILAVTSQAIERIRETIRRGEGAARFAKELAAYEFSVDCTRRSYEDSVTFCKDQGKSIASIHS